MTIKDQFRCPADAPDAVGIVVRNRRRGAEPPRTAGFVWGASVYVAPSLPFGRWKPVPQAG